MRIISGLFAAASLSLLVGGCQSIGQKRFETDSNAAWGSDAAAQSSVDSFGNSPTGATSTTAARHSGGISDEQDFAAVSARETIESDAQRLERFQGANIDVKPVALPDRPKGGTSSVVQFALSTTNNVGESIYPRSRFSGDSRFKRNCARYSSGNMAQQAFLDAGGPQKDRKGLDPDGDGFACNWTPTAFRKALVNSTSQGDVIETGVSKADLEALGITGDTSVTTTTLAPAKTQ